MTDRPSQTPDDRLARVRASLEESARLTRETLEVAGPRIAEAGELLVATFREGGRLLAIGNGGSAADAQHLCAELAGRFDRERPGLPALALTTNSSDVTAIGNDYGFERVFARLVEAARDRGLRVVGLLGKGGGALAARVDVAIAVPSDVTARVQESHIAVLHALCELVEGELFPETVEA